MVCAKHTYNTPTYKYSVKCPERREGRQHNNSSPSHSFTISVYVRLMLLIFSSPLLLSMFTLWNTVQDCCKHVWNDRRIIVALHKVFVHCTTLTKCSKSFTMSIISCQVRSANRKIPFKTTVKRSMVGHLLHHSNWFTMLIEGIIDGCSGRGRPRQEYVDEIKGGRKYVVIKRLPWKGRNCKPTNLWTEEKKSTVTSINILIKV